MSLRQQAQLALDPSRRRHLNVDAFLSMHAGMTKLMDNDTETGPINIGNPTEFTMLELAKVTHLPCPIPASLLHADMPLHAVMPGRSRSTRSLI